MKAKVDPTSGFASIMQYCFPSTLFGGDPNFFLKADCRILKLWIEIYFSLQVLPLINWVP